MSELLKEDAPDAASLRGQLKTFSAVFDGDPIDEREYIETAVESTGADTTYTNPTSHEFIGELRDFVWHQEEPIVSTGPYAQWCVMRSAREQVTVLLDGQGGDELIAGYVPYQLVYLRQLRKERKYDVLREESMAARDVLWPLAKRRIKQRRKQLPTRTLLRARLPRPDHRTPGTGAPSRTSRSASSRTCSRTACRACCATRTATPWRSASRAGCRTWTRSSSTTS